MTASSSYRSSPAPASGTLRGFLLGILFTVILLAGGLWLFLRFGHPPVAVADQSLPFEHEIVEVPLQARLARDLQQPPFGISEDVYESGAHLYVNNCSGCHGTPDAPAALGAHMYPHAPQLWHKHRNSAVVGVSDDEPGETYWKIANGIRLSGMPAYDHTLTTTQMWQIALLLKNADQPLPAPVQAILTPARP